MRRMAASGLFLIFSYSSSTCALVGASKQSKRRSTVSGRITLRYSLRLYGPRSRLQMLQMKLASWEWVLGLIAFNRSFLYRKLASADLTLCDAYDAAIFKLFVITETLADILGFEVWVSCQDFLG